MNVVRFFALAVLAWAGCSSGQDMDDWVCQSSCSTVTFTLPRPLGGPTISIAVTAPDGTVERLDCQPTGGSLACLPLSSPLQPSFDANGDLQSVSLEQAARGAYNVDLIVDGVRMAGGTFQYEASPIIIDRDPCGGGGTSCPGPQSFTLVAGS